MLDEEDQKWIEPWVELWGDKMTRMAFLIIHDRELAQDVVQEAFFRLHRQHCQNPHVSISVGWLYAVTRNVALDARRKRKRDGVPFPIESEDMVSPNFESAVAMRLDVDKVLSQLSQKDRECLWLFYYAGLSTPEIAEALHMSNVSVRKRLHRARCRFSTIWKEMTYAEK